VEIKTAQEKQKQNGGKNMTIVVNPLSAGAFF